MKNCLVKKNSGHIEIHLSLKNRLKMEEIRFELKGIGTEKYTVKISCKSCGNEGKTKAGIVKDRQRYKCTGCKKRYVAGEKAAERKVKQQVAVELYLEGMCIRSIARYLKVSHTTIGRWLKQSAKARKMPLPAKVNFIEIDELYFYLKSKKKKKWLWLAICRESKRILAYQTGGRGKETLRKLYYKISPINTLMIYTDDHAPFKGVLPKGKHSTRFAQTNTIEGMNSAVRHYLARFRRRSKCYNKSITMTEASIDLLMYKYHENYLKHAA